MKVLHTADWHAGRTLHGRDRTPDIAAALESMASRALAEGVDAVVVAGDLFDVPTPSAAADQAVYDTLHEFATAGVPVVLIAGNHDSPNRIDALSGFLSLGNVFAFGHPRIASKGGVQRIATRSGSLTVAVAPFVSYRRLVRASHLLDLGEDSQRLTYQSGMRALLANLGKALRPGETNVLAMHGTMDGSTLSSEYTFHSHDAYALPVDVIPKSVTYAALGHIHAPQSVDRLDPNAARYPGSLVQLDFGDAIEERSALIVHFRDGRVDYIDDLPVECPRPLRVESITFDSLEAWSKAHTPGSALVKLRVAVTEPKPGVKERLLREHPDLAVVEFALPEHERPEPLRVDVGEIDFEQAFVAYHLDQRGREPSAEVLAAFRRVDRATTSEDAQ